MLIAHRHHTGAIWLTGSLALGTVRIWTFGGQSSTGYAGDLWAFDPLTRQWAFMAGYRTTRDAVGVYGSRGVFSPVTRPGGTNYLCNLQPPLLDPRSGRFVC